MVLDEHEIKRRLLLRLKSIESGRLLIGPATVRLHIMDLCNLHCHFCWEHRPGTPYRATSKNNFSFEAFENIARDCAELQVDAVHLSGLGEPTMHPRFYDMLRLLETSFKVTVFSNGTFPIERCRDILRADHIVINIGESDRESYRASYGRDFFVKVIKNIRELARLKAQFNPDFCIEVVIVVTDLNEATQLRTEAFVKKLGADLVHKKVAYVRESPEGEDNVEFKGDWPPCYYGWFYSAIKLNGDVNVCCFMDRVTIGNVLTTSFKDIWQSEEYARARVSAISGDPFRNYYECANCRLVWDNKNYAKQMVKYNQIRKASAILE
jgi:MoaA/NifB/PqqE/SkfB family radical SAM enzyme